MSWYILMHASCIKQEKVSADVSIGKDTLFTLLPAEQTKIDFVNTVQDDDTFNILTYRNFYNGGGVAIGDINNDGLADVYFTANKEKNKLYLNQGNWKFEDITEQAGVGGNRAWSTGVTMADVNGDGWLDIYVCNSGDVSGDDRENELFINQGIAPGEQKFPIFIESAKKYNLNDEGFSTHASFFDYDQDGDLDCYVLNNSFKNPDKISTNTYSVSRFDKDNLGGDKLFRNDGNTFTEVTQQAGIYNSKIGFGLGISVSDLNGDMLPDMYISNDFWERDYLYFNKGNGKFSEELADRISVCSVSSMGSDIADLNNDGTYDIFTTDMLPADNYRLKTMTVFDPYHLEDLKYRSSYHYQILQNTLQLNDGKGDFQEIAHLAGVGATDWSWGALLFDFENDGWKDIFVSNGIYRDIMYLDFTNFINDQDEVKKVVQAKGRFSWQDFAAYIPSNPIPNYAFKNKLSASGASIPVFVNKSTELGLAKPGFSNGAAYGDLDNDGDMDLVVNNVNMTAYVYRNNTKKNYLKLKFSGPGKNPFGIGATAIIESGNKKQFLQNFQSRGFESAVEPVLVFGLGSDSIVQKLTVTWPDRKSQFIQNVSANQTITLNYQNAEATPLEATHTTTALFKDATDLIKGDHRHKENTFNDFDTERLLPRMLSTEGPKIIKGDVNGDKKEDFVLLGAAEDPDKIFVQQVNGFFIPSNQAEMDADKSQESTCGSLFDADGDGDQDLLIGSGGNEIQKGINAFVLRYYENDGQGNFIKMPEKTPLTAGNFSCIVPCDIDNDRDQDLFIGGRIVPGNYGLPPRSYLFRNDGNGKWTDIIPQKFGAFGMVTDATWSDTDQDGDKDLILVGEWMPILILENEHGQLVNRKIIPNSFGWWNKILAKDLNKDGKDDFILGNWGINSKFKADNAKPLVMYVKDFDNNKKSEFIINWYAPLDPTPFPFASKKDMLDQLPHLKKTNVKFEDYAHKKYETLFTEQERKNAMTYVATYLESAILWNDKDSFKLASLPLEAQVSPVFSIVAEDLDEDGFTDIWLGGNFYGLKPEAGRLDSSKGVLLKGSAQGIFYSVSSDISGIHIHGEVRDAQTIAINNKPCILMARNNMDSKCFCK